MSPISHIFVFALCAASAMAQQVAMRDLSKSSWKLPDSRVARVNENCTYVDSRIRDGVLVSGIALAPEGAEPSAKEAIQLSIVDISPKELRIEASFVATIRLQNVGTTMVRLPWEIDGNKSLRLSSDGKEESFSAVDILFTLTTGHDASTSASLEGGGVLFADPDRNSGFIELKPGQWADLKVGGRAKCSKGGTLCVPFKADNEATMVATWYERVLTRSVSDCKDEHGAFTSRELQSEPFHLPVLSQ